MGNRSTVAFTIPVAVCRDPLNSNGYYLADQNSIRYFDEAKDEVTLFVGGPTDAAEFNEIYHLLITSDGKTLWFAEGDRTLWRADTVTRHVTTAAYQWITGLCWDPHRASRQILYFIAIRRVMAVGLTDFIRNHTNWSAVR